jgi:hypothetical protein
MTTTPAQPASGRQNLLARHPLVSFFVMAYAFSWNAWALGTSLRMGSAFCHTIQAPR